VSAELIHDQDADALYAKVLDAAVTIMASDFGSLQMFHPERGPAGELQLLACHGFDPETVKFWEWVRADSNCSCAAALRTGQRAVISDVEKCDFMAGTQDLASYLRAGMRAAQSTPLVSRAGNLVGMLSTHWRTPHDPSPRGLRLLDVLARQAADLIERKLAKEALRCRQEALEQADRHKDQFIAMLAHELRNPLSAIRMGAELLDRAEIDDRKARFAVTAITRQATQLRRISDDLLDIARVSHGKLELRRQPINLLAVVKAVVADYVSLLRGNAAIRIEGRDCWADADLARVQQMIGNLIDNAVKYGGRNIAIRVARKSQWSRIMVKDDGQGIAPELLASLFEPFVQGAQPVDGMQGGLGLGLALVDRLASLHGGGIEARSEGPGKGSAFILSLPAAEKPRAARKSSSGAGRAKQRILVVEDEDDSRECLRLLLESDGYDVAFAEDGAHGLAQFSSFRPDVALVDIGLPGMDGYELVRRARRLPGGKEIPIIAITGYGGDKHRQQALKAGFDLHITKPLSHEELMRALATERTDATAQR
jgi:signal transduction histidine kinase/ActR/RegA family two-component response regulator